MVARQFNFVCIMSTIKLKMQFDILYIHVTRANVLRTRIIEKHRVLLFLSLIKMYSSINCAV